MKNTKNDIKQKSVYILDRKIGVRIKSLGLVEINKFSWKDVTKLTKVIQNKNNDKEFLYRAIFNQLLKPKISIRSLKKVPLEELIKIARHLVKNEKHIFKYFTDSGDFLKDFKRSLVTVQEKQKDKFKEIIDPEIILDVQKIIIDGFQNLRGITEMNHVIQQVLLKRNDYTEFIRLITCGAFKILEPFKDLDKIGLTPNLGKTRSLASIKKYKRLLKMGYAIFWVPRAEIIEELMRANNEAERRKAILSFKPEILEDCKKIITSIKNPKLNNYKLHMLSAIDCMKSENYRAAQSTSSICFDAILDQIVDITSLNNYRELGSTLKNNSLKLKKINNIQVHFVYAALQAHLIMYSLRSFDRLKPRKVRQKFGRHPSIHSVSARQYSEFNAMQVIMITTSLIATTNKLGVGWLTTLASKT